MDAAENVWRPLGESLVRKGLLTRAELEQALVEQERTGRMLGAILVDRGLLSGPSLAVALAEQYGVELATQRGFGTGLWAEIDRRHQARRSQDEPNVVRLEPVKRAAVEAVPDPESDPRVEALHAENRRLLDEVDRLEGERGRLRAVETAAAPSEHLLFVPTPARYLLLEREGVPPAVGVELELPELDGRFVVTRIGRAPYPAEERPCAFLLPSA